jgi:hypothetical protein
VYVKPESFRASSKTKYGPAPNCHAVGSQMMPAAATTQCSLQTISASLKTLHVRTSACIPAARMMAHKIRLACQQEGAGYTAACTRLVSAVRTVSGARVVGRADGAGRVVPEWGDAGGLLPLSANVEALLML